MSGRVLFRDQKKAVDPLRLFHHLSEGGRAPHAFLLESAEQHERNARISLGCADPCLKIEGTGDRWLMAALNQNGEAVLRRLLPDLGFASARETESGDDGPRRLEGHFDITREVGEERDRLRRHGPTGLLRAIHTALRDAAKGSPYPGGLFGTFSYDFVSTFESLPDGQDNPWPVPDFEFVLADHLFVIDRLLGRCFFSALAVNSDKPEAAYHRAQDRIRAYETALDQAPALDSLGPPVRLDPAEVRADLDDAAFARQVADLKEKILAGDIFQIVPSRSFTAPLRESPLDVYRRLRDMNPSPYMFFFRRGERTLLGASPETALKVSADGDVEIRPIAGTKPRGRRSGEPDADLDSRYETELKLDRKEIAEHMMLVDLARNDVARVCQAGSRLATHLLEVEKYVFVQHLVSRVVGRLRQGLDPLHAYLATMNMGTLTGAPKVEAMSILRGVEKTRRGYYGGAVGYWMLSGDFDTAIVIRSLHIEGGRAIVRAGAGIVHDSIPEREAAETTAKAAAPLSAIGLRPRSEEGEPQ